MRNPLSIDCIASTSFEKGLPPGIIATRSFLNALFNCAAIARRDDSSNTTPLTGDCATVSAVCLAWASF